jgi:hypothetical protein
MGPLKKLTVASLKFWERSYNPGHPTGTNHFGKALSSTLGERTVESASRWLAIQHARIEVHMFTHDNKYDLGRGCWTWSITRSWWTVADVFHFKAHYYGGVQSCLKVYGLQSSRFRFDVTSIFSHTVGPRKRLHTISRSKLFSSISDIRWLKKRMSCGWKQLHFPWTVDGNASSSFAWTRDQIESSKYRLLFHNTRRQNKPLEFIPHLFFPLKLSDIIHGV